MTVDDLLERDHEDTIWLRGADVGAFCDLMERYKQRPAGYGDWSTIRASAYIMGQKLPPTWMDEIPRLWIGQALNRDWFIPA